MDADNNGTIDRDEFIAYLDRELPDDPQHFAEDIQATPSRRTASGTFFLSPRAVVRLAPRRSSHAKADGELHAPDYYVATGIQRTGQLRCRRSGGQGVLRFQP